MRAEYDIKKLNPRKNPYSKLTKKQITINLDEDTIIYFKNQSENTGIPYQILINLYLRDCVKNNRRLEFSIWFILNVMNCIGTKTKSKNGNDFQRKSVKPFFIYDDFKESVSSEITSFKVRIYKSRPIGRHLIKNNFERSEKFI